MSARRYSKGFELCAAGLCVALSFGWRWRWLIRRDEGLKLCILGVLLEVGTRATQATLRGCRLPLPLLAVLPDHEKEQA